MTDCIEYSLAIQAIKHTKTYEDFNTAVMLANTLKPEGENLTIWHSDKEITLTDEMINGSTVGFDILTKWMWERL